LRPRSFTARRVDARLIGLGATVGSIAYLLGRSVEDVYQKPLFEDEAVSGLVSAQPLGELFRTVMWERGGGPLHFLLAHVTLAVDGSAFALRWLSLVFALATLPLCYDLARRLAGHTAGIAAVVVAATSTMLAVYGSFARMYTLYAFASALALDLFVRALRRRTGAAAFAAACAAWLLPAIHPFGAMLVAAEALVALAVWRGRPLRPALPVAAVALAMIPFAVADVRLAGRFDVGLDGESRIAAPSDAFDQALRAVAASAGGRGWAFGVFLAIAIAGLVVLARREPAFAAVAVACFGIPPILLVYAKTGSDLGLSPRHLIFLLPLTAALVGVGLANAVRTWSSRSVALALTGFSALAIFAPSGGVFDPRDWSNDVLGGGSAGRALGGEDALAEPSAWLRRVAGPGDVLFPYSAVYLSALPATGQATALPYGQSSLLLETLERAPRPVREVFVSVPLGEASLEHTILRQELGPRFSYKRFDRWLLIRTPGPFFDPRDVLEPIRTSLIAARDAVEGNVHYELSWYFADSLSAVCGSLRTLGADCPQGVSSRAPPASAG
jgi:hypothetical protein